MSEKEEKKNRFLAALASIGIHLAILALFLFVMGWTAPDPPLSELGSGVELNLGLDQEGSGDVQPEVPASGNEKEAGVKVQEQSSQDKQAEDKQEVKEKEPKAAEENLSSTEESPVTTKEVKKEEKKTTKDKTTETKPQEKATPDSNPVDKNAVKDPTAGKIEGDKTKSASGASQGDDKNKKGDKGSPEGSLDPNAQYTGKPGKGGAGDGGGGGISISGFDGFEKPKISPPEVPEDSYGTYVFLVQVNNEGDIIKITPQTRGLSLEAEKIFRKLIENTEFVPTKNNLPALSEGKITFKIVAAKMQ